MRRLLPSLTLFAFATTAAVSIALADPGRPAARRVPPPAGLAQLGTSCTAGQPIPVCAAGELTCTCGRAGRVAVVSMPLDRYGWRAPAPFTGASCVVEPAGGGARHRSLTVTVDAQRVWIRHETCGQCARQMGDAVLFVPAALDAPQLEALQTSLGFAASPLLRTPAAWLAAQRQRPGATCH